MIDPYNYVINATAAGNIVTALGSNNLVINTNTLVAGYYDASGDCPTCGDIQLNNAISYSGSNDRSLTFKADSSIILNANIESTGTGALDIILWSDQQAKGGNGVGGLIYLASGVELKSNGGNIILAGGADDGSNGGTASDGIPDGYAWNKLSSAYGGVQLGPMGDSGATSINLLSSGGDIIIRGKTSDSTGYPGFTSQGKIKIDSGAGSITINGQSTSGHGTEFTYGATAQVAITSAKISGTAIDITGVTSRDGYQGLWLTNSSGNVLIQATGGGAVNLTGTNSDTIGGDGFFLSSNGTVQILSQSGTITLDGTGARYDIHSNYNGTSSLYVGNRKNDTTVNLSLIHI